MSDVENARAQAESLNEPAGRALRSARRAQLWAGLNKYLASEAAHARRTAAGERKQEKDLRVGKTGKDAGERKTEKDAGEGAG